LSFICKDRRPFNIVEGDGFIHLIKELEPILKLPGAKFLKKKLEERYVSRLINRRYGQIEYNDQTSFATILDTRFKNLHFQDPVACGKAIQKLKENDRVLMASSESE